MDRIIHLLLRQAYCNARGKLRPLFPSIRDWSVRLIIANVVGLLCACSSTSKIAKQEKPIEVEPLPQIEKVADRPFTSETLYALLVAEMALDRRRYDVALNNYVQQALTTRDPNVTAMATQLARFLKVRSASREMAQLWVEVDPYNEDAQIIFNQELIDAGELGEALKHSKQLLAKGLNAGFESIAHRVPKENAETVDYFLNEYLQLMENHSDNKQLLIGYSILLQKSGRLEESLAVTRKIMKQAPESIPAAFQETQILIQMGEEQEAIKRLSALVDQYPTNSALRTRYARFIVNHDIQEAQVQFAILHKQEPDDGYILFLLAMVEKQNGALDSAASRFQSLISRRQYTSSAHYYLAQIYDKQQRFEEALDQYLLVGTGKNYLNALIRATEILVKQEKEFEAIELVREQKQIADNENKEGIYVLEADILTSVGQLNASEIVLTKGLEEFPKSTKLLYARAMLYAKIDYISAAEQDLKQIIEMVPNNAAALNALGYTLADRTDRIEEAYGYIQRAYKLTPDNPAVLDSVGWVEYRLGNYEEALIKLRQAMKGMPDHEIAAHLGEVLWITGVHDEARTVWQEGLRLNPNSEIIHKTVHRLNATLK